ncbi:thiolase family protein [Youngiibacter multivorans]|uniref:acetyl-CoA C-acetyltransferase n=1 Tax=Youngiibacter multivorans TaxID=937251 RepID=A0ABS4FZA2_9CLOT|nr:thiolase family protein [Youngiibacter multivorans]MBP1917640.1 acetyl-CoA C-acetyltransferase [Youngiibacter multivorans]
MKEVVIVSASRTPIGSFMGAFSDVQAKTLGAVSLRETIRRSGIDPRIIDEVIIGNISGTDPKGNPAREAALDAGVPIEVPVFTVNKNCASSIKSVSLAAALIKAGEADIMLAGGMENMTRIPYIIRNARKGLRMGKDTIDDLLSDLLEGMGMTAERLVEMYNISREEQDRFAYSSQMKAAKAMESGAFDDEIIPVDVITRKGTVTISKDEGVKPGTTLEGLAKLRATFKKDGTVTAGNSSTINDAGASVLLMSGDKAKELQLKPMAKVVGWASAGCDPDIMGIGPVPATRKLLDKTGMKLSDFGLVELNEAFAAQSLAVLRELDFDIDKVNVNGGGIALGHPTGATGSVLITKLIYAMKKRNVETGLVTLCIGGGQGMSIAIENM